MGLGSDEAEPPQLPLFSAPPFHSHEPSGTLTPPLHTSVSVPFRWEEQPGKPRPCTALATIPNPTDFSQKCLELPPRLLLEAKLLSPTTVLEGPYVGRSKFQSSSFRMECYGGFGPERGGGELGALVLRRKGKERGWLDSWGRRVLKGKREVGGASYVFPSSVDGESDGGGSVGGESGRLKTKKKMTGITRVGSFSSLSHAKPHFWATIKQSLKQAVPWKGRKFKEGGFAI